MISDLLEALAEAREAAAAADEKYRAVRAPLQAALEAGVAAHKALLDSLVEDVTELTAMAREAYTESMADHRAALVAGELSRPPLLPAGWSVRQIKTVLITDPGIVPRGLCKPEPSLIRKALESGPVPVPGAELQSYPSFVYSPKEPNA